MSKSADSLARKHTEKAINVLAEVMDDPFAENKERIAAANSLLDRGHGKPLTATIALPSTQAHRAMLAALSDEELMERITGAQLPRLVPARHIEAEFSEVDPLLS